MLIVADENIAFARECFAPLGELRLLPGRAIDAADVADADVLLVRSVTRVDAGLLAGSSVRFVGSCTIGTDHVDLAWLQSQGIRFSWAPGCNARAVVQYVLTALAALDVDVFGGLRVGVLGCGNIGGHLLRRLLRAGVQACGCDPFLSHSGLPLVSFDEWLHCDVLCLHTPLTHGGPHPTFHLLDAAAIARLRPGALLLNAGRGAVIDNAALLARLAASADLQVVLDVWENEPAISSALLAAVTIGTPHIAGYSAEGKWRGTEMVWQDLCGFLGVAAVAPVAAVATSGPRDPYDIWADDNRLREQYVRDGAAAFDRLRKLYVPRPEGSVMLRGRLIDY